MCDAPRTMWKKFLKLLPVMLIAGCATSATITRLTPSEVPRNPNNQYLVETSFESPQQSLIPDSLKASIVVDGQIIPMTQVAVVNNRWEGYLPVPPDKNSVTYRFLFDYKYNSFGAQPKSETKYSPPYTLKIAE